MTTLETVPATLTLTLFGPMQVSVEGVPLSALRSRKAMALLALLALRHGRNVEREWLAGTLWPDSDQDQAAASLRPVLSELRKALGAQGARLQSPSRNSLCLERVGVRVDVADFDAAIASQKHLALERAVALYRGPLLEGSTEEWADQERVAREQDLLRALETLAATANAAGNYGSAADLFRRAIGFAPGWEAARRGLMDSLARNGDRNGALQVYREFIDSLKNDPRAIPAEETSALYARLRAEAKQLAAHPSSVQSSTADKTTAVSGYLPQPLTEIVGREDERLDVAQRLRRSRLVTLTGPGGIGKTRLALAVAADVATDYGDGVWFVAFDTISNPQLYARQIAYVLGLKEEPTRSCLVVVTEHIRPKRLLLVMDNCEHLLETSAYVADLILRECAGVRILATSRETLGITGEAAWTVPSLAVPEPANLPTGLATRRRVLMGYEGVRLFVERAQAVQKTFVVTDANSLAVSRVCAFLEGVPLAIELAAARIKSMTVTQIADRLDDQLGLLTGGSRAAQLRQQTMRATLDWSFNLLSESERLLLMRLSVFVGGWSLEAAEAVCAGHGIAGQDEIKIGKILDLLTSLVDKSLVIFEEHGPDGQGRYRLLETVRQYAEKGLEARGGSDELKARHRDWLIMLVVEAERNWTGPEASTWHRKLSIEHPNLRATLDWGESKPNLSDSNLHLAALLWRFWLDNGEYNQGRLYLRKALEQDTGAIPSEKRASALDGAGALAYRQGDYIEARRLYGEGLNIWRELGIKTSIAASLGNLGNSVLLQGEYETAAVLYQESLNIRRELGDRKGIALSLENVSVVKSSQGNYEAARADLVESLNIRRELGDKLGIAHALGNLGNLSKSLGSYSEAQTLFEECAFLVKELEVKYGIAWSLNSLGSVVALRGDHAWAQKLHEESLSLYREMDEQHGIAESLSSLGMIASLRGDNASAKALYQESLKMCGQIGYRQGVEGILRRLATLFLRTDTAKAVMLWGSTSTLRESLRTPIPPNEHEEYDSQCSQAHVLLGEGAFAAAWDAGRALTWEQCSAYALRNSA